MKTTITTLTIALGISLGATAQDENTKRSAEFQVLDRFVGGELEQGRLLL